MRDREHTLARRRPRGAARRGFTIIEMIVVIAITALLMTILFVPLSRTLDLVSRGNARVTSQDSVRAAMRTVRRDLSNAMQVFPPRPIHIWGYRDWTYDNRKDRPEPLPNSPSERYLVENGVFAFRLPKHQYHCPRFDHTILPTEADPNLALDTCPRHLGSPIEMRPLSPLEPDDKIVAYFLALKDPTVTDGQGLPQYRNIALFSNVATNTLNTYTLYRLEFDPRLPQFARWTIDADGDGQVDDPNPNFFYETQNVTGLVGGQQVTLPAYQWWRDASRVVVNQQQSDMVKWLASGAKWLPHPITTMGPAPVSDADLLPNRNVGLFNQDGSTLPASIPSAEYLAEFGHWLGLENDGQGLIPATWVIKPDGQTGTYLRGPRIQIFDFSLAPAQQLVFDSADATRRNRLVSYDSMTGRVTFAMRRFNYGTNDPVLMEHYSAPAPSAANLYTVDLTLDQVSDPNNMPSSFGAAKVWEGNNALRQGTSLIVPGSEEVQLTFQPASGPREVEILRRVGWTGLGNGVDRYVAQADLAPDEYTIDYRTGIIGLADRDPNRWSGVAPGGQRQLLVKHRFQTNRPGDVVKASFVTQEAALANLGLVEFTRAKGEKLPFEVSERIVIRNLKR
ncbi:MAG: type II secretion system protein J [Armatimonadota bacterium]